MKLPIYQVDAFASAVFRGNPAAVCLLETEMDAAWMQAVAQEMNLSETAFLFPLEDGLEVLYRESGFTVNFARGLGIILCWLALLASLGLIPMVIPPLAAWTERVDWGALPGGVLLVLGRHHPDLPDLRNPLVRRLSSSLRSPS